MTLFFEVYSLPLLELFPSSHPPILVANIVSTTILIKELAKGHH